MNALPRTSGYIAVVGASPQLDRPDGVASALLALGAEVRVLHYRADPRLLMDALDDELGIHPRAIVVELLDRPDLAIGSRCALRAHALFDDVGALLVVHEHHVIGLETRDAFDDFLVAPYSAAELYVRIRALRARSPRTSKDVCYELGDIRIDSSAREVRVGNRAVSLTRKEYALLIELCARNGRAISRQQLLTHIWGFGYDGGRRTVDIHVRRLRAKLGPSLALETVHGLGYRLRAPASAHSAAPRSYASSNSLRFRGPRRT